MCAALPLGDTEPQERGEVVWIRSQDQLALLRGRLQRWPQSFTARQAIVCWRCEASKLRHLSMQDSVHQIASSSTCKLSGIDTMQTIAFDHIGRSQATTVLLPMYQACLTPPHLVIAAP